MSPRRLLANLALAGGSTAFALLLLEFALRLVLPAPIHFRYPQESYDFDPEIAHVLHAGQHAFTHDREVATNSRGLRDAEYPPEPAPGVVRVLALGDSQTFGNGLDLADSWPKQLEADLNRERPAGSARFEVLNAGIPGSDTWQHEVVLDRLADAYHPHAVVLAFYVNDVSPRYVPEPIRTEEMTNTWSKRLAYLVKRSAVVSWVYQRMQLLHVEQELEQGRAYGEYIMTGQASPEVESGWQQVRSSLAAMQKRCAERGIDFRVAVLPRRDQVSGLQAARVYNQRIAGIAAELGIRSLDLLPDLAAAYSAGSGEKLFIPWDGHNSAAANRVIAQRLAGELLPLGTRVAAR